MLFSASDITKSFAGVQALKGVSFELREGEVHALVGENGAGKSTLIKIITGALAPDSGTLKVNGHVLTHHSPAHARSLGIAAVYQQPALFPHLTVAENIALSLEGGGMWRRVDWKAAPRGPANCWNAPAPISARPAGVRAEHAGAADRGDRQGHRRGRQGPDPGRAHRFAHGPRSGEPLPRDRHAARRKASASSIFRTAWKRSPPSPAA